MIWISISLVPVIYHLGFLGKCILQPLKKSSLAFSPNETVRTVRTVRQRTKEGPLQKILQAREVSMRGYCPSEHKLYKTLWVMTNTWSTDLDYTACSDSVHDY